MVIFSFLTRRLWQVSAVLLCASGAVLAPAQAPPEPPNGALWGEVESSFRGNHIFVKATVRKIPVWLMLDTGAPKLGLDDGLAAELDVELTDKGPDDARTDESRFISGVDLSLVCLPRNMDFRVEFARLCELKGLQQMLGDDVRGILGGDLFKRAVVEIDYEARRVRVFRPDLFVYSGPGEVLPVIARAPIPIALVTVLAPDHTCVGLSVFIDTGSGSDLDITSTTTKNLALLAPNSITRATRSVTYYGVQAGVSFPLPGLRVGGLELGKVQVTTDSDSLVEKAVDGSLGAGLLKRFQVIIDYRRSRIILEPNRAYQHPEPEVWTGFVGNYGADGAGFVVDVIDQDSPAQKAGLQVGDLVTRIGDRPIRELRHYQVREILRAHIDKPLTLGVNRSGSEFEVTIVPATE